MTQPAAKLTALDTAASQAPWHFSGNDPDSKYRDEELIVALRNVLAEIIAVVEAAQDIRDFQYDGDKYARGRARDALADLSAKLEAEGSATR